MRCRARSRWSMRAARVTAAAHKSKRTMRVPHRPCFPKQGRLCQFFSSLAPTRACGRVRRCGTILQAPPFPRRCGTRWAPRTGCNYCTAGRRAAWADRRPRAAPISELPAPKRFPPPRRPVSQARPRTPSRLVSFWKQFLGGNWACSLSFSFCAFSARSSCLTLRRINGCLTLNPAVITTPSSSLQ